MARSILFLFLLLPLFGLHAENLTSTSFQIENPIVIISGGQSSSASFQHISSTGELALGQSTSASFIGRLGFLYYFEDEETPVVSDSGGGSSGAGSEKGIFPGFCKIADLNCDGFVNISDLSILLYYFEQKGIDISRYDLSVDDIIDLRDASVMFYYWDF
ncbi:hypothetical protein A2733_02345 [Candidatus Nomurabacteria bacterium RIFCSPHIGHO2_01_FULL_40_20]|uniref:Dockerin domain-containing protein n=1 Tax=Candidatus Nomurabacteria bacterium RIFCSPHIGHO2_01_FULL_40_20 TaxID=1801738 RepID=A0A1F6V2E3_9BACT|nr:MAG: hypothetical protein A2733_02345 [Candidatus Nomurabacteria bacterium RIFCSPHIGHO2_01_FULL_40_20]